MSKLLVIDGALGEGGGQILRSSLALSLVTGRPFRIENIRAGRSKPGLRKQHLAAVRAAATVSRARVTGDTLNSAVLEFHPAGRFGGDHRFDVGGAGSCSLVLQTVLPALIIADSSSRIVLTGGTHNPFAPPFHFLSQVFLPLLNRMGPQVQAKLRQWGFYPNGRGEMAVDITPAPRLSSLNLTVRGELNRSRLRAIVAALPLHIAQRECRAFSRAVDHPFEVTAEALPAPSGPGNVLMAEIGYTRIRELFSTFGRRSVPAEKVACELADQVNTYLATSAPIGPYLADQLLVPLAIAGSGAYRTMPLTRHTRTNIAIVRQFLEIAIKVQPAGATEWEIKIGTA
jgi:RNA 3'-terminal phosphate cyclase (ATP)